MGSDTRNKGCWSPRFFFEFIPLWIRQLPFREREKDSPVHSLGKTLLTVIFRSRRRMRYRFPEKNSLAPFVQSPRPAPPFFFLCAPQRPRHRPPPQLDYMPLLFPRSSTRPFILLLPSTDSNIPLGLVVVNEPQSLRDLPLEEFSPLLDVPRFRVEVP